MKYEEETREESDSGISAMEDARCHMNTKQKGQPQCRRRAIAVCNHGNGYCAYHLSKSKSEGMTCPITPVGRLKYIHERKDRR